MAERAYVPTSRRPYCTFHRSFEAGHDSEACDLPTQTVVHTVTTRLPVEVTPGQIARAAGAAEVQWEEADDNEYAGDQTPDPAEWRSVVTASVTIDGVDLQVLLPTQAPPNGVAVQLAAQVLRLGEGELEPGWEHTILVNPSFRAIVRERALERAGGDEAQVHAIELAVRVIEDAAGGER